MKNLRQVLSNKLILTTLVIWILSAPLLWYSGIFVGQGPIVLGGLLYLAYVLLGIADIVCYWLIFFDGRK